MHTQSENIWCLIYSYMEQNIESSKFHCGAATVKMACRVWLIFYPNHVLIPQLFGDKNEINMKEKFCGVVCWLGQAG